MFWNIISQGFNQQTSYKAPLNLLKNGKIMAELELCLGEANIYQCK